ncbi:zinc finger MYM-type protein 1 [Trichonephila inaurata madagascariensis]|uniref:Zinc finger MYM-type protein 1 n=1 Tax=Trichonephila inaurata madagascariensis TaxID=2747483 RepID=A0A8X7C6E6_9ARAC|nr:zinc finger MYM-type protein 1 [Trichonephila inaurata madagascariensis]
MSETESVTDSDIAMPICYTLLNSGFTLEDSGVTIKDKLSTKLFVGELSSGEKYKRDWLLYLKLKGQVFRFYCLLLQPDKKCGVLAAGCNDWKNSFALALQHERVVSIVNFLSARGLPFRCDDQQLGSTTKRLFLRCLELISEFDLFLSQHLTKCGNKGKGSASYLSSDICSEFIRHEEQKQEILKEIKLI